MSHHHGWAFALIGGLGVWVAVSFLIMIGPASADVLRSFGRRRRARYLRDLRAAWRHVEKPQSDERSSIDQFYRIHRRHR